MELEEQSGVDTYKGDSEKNLLAISASWEKRMKRGCFFVASCMVVERRF